MLREIYIKMELKSHSNAQNLAPLHRSAASYHLGHWYVQVAGTFFVDSPSKGTEVNTQLRTRRSAQPRARTAPGPHSPAGTAATAGSGPELSARPRERLPAESQPSPALGLARQGLCGHQQPREA